MGANSKIEWCHHSFNPWVGCTKLSAACDFCYAEGWARRTGQPELWAGERRRTAPANWRQPLKWNAVAKAAGERHRVFCASLADVFDNQVPQEWRADLWRLILECQNLDWLLLTKRPQNVADMCGSAMPGNVWLGITAENQPELERRWPYASAISARVHFISYEPALGALNILDLYPLPDWIICGGESGPKARPMNPQWARSLRDQCAEAGVAFFFKQWGEWIPSVSGVAVGPSGIIDANSVKFSDVCADKTTAWMTRVGKKLAGRLLDGRTHDEFPR